jgi:hypothetical protein
VSECVSVCVFNLTIIVIFIYNISGPVNQRNQSKFRLKARNKRVNKPKHMLASLYKHPSALLVRLGDSLAGPTCAGSSMGRGLAVTNNSLLELLPPPTARPVPFRLDVSRFLRLLPCGLYTSLPWSSRIGCMLPSGICSVPCRVSSQEDRFAVEIQNSLLQSFF